MFSGLRRERQDSGTDGSFTLLINILFKNYKFMAPDFQNPQFTQHLASIVKSFPLDIQMFFFFL